MEKQETTNIKNEAGDAVEMTPKKVCRDCGQELPETQFARGRWGYLDVCLDCMRKKRGGRRGGGNYHTPVGEAAKPTPLSIYTDTNLIEELHRRGWEGKLRKVLEVDV